MSTPRGRFDVLCELNDCGLWDSPVQNQDVWTYHNLGKLALAQVLHRRLTRLCPEQFLEMLKEREEKLLGDVSSEKEQTISDFPVSTIPELKKFIKPKFFQAKDHEYFIGKEYRNNTQTYPGPPTIYEMPPKQNSIKTDKGIYLKKLRAL